MYQGTLRLGVIQGSIDFRGVKHLSDYMVLCTVGVVKGYIYKGYLSLILILTVVLENGIGGGLLLCL